jgi:hypothetical protein
VVVNWSALANNALTIYFFGAVVGIIVSVFCSIDWKQKHPEAPHVGYLIGGLIMVAFIWPISLLGFLWVTAKRGFLYWFRQLVPRRYKDAPPDGPAPKSGPHR